MKKIVILGSTGSIGVNALKIIASMPDRFKVLCLSARNNMEILAQQIDQFKPKIVSVADKARADKLKKLTSANVKIVTGIEGAIECASCPDADLALSAMVGAAGLAPTLAAIKSGKDIALANKETLVTAGKLVTSEARAAKTKIIPVDSEHSAIFQALRGEKRKSVKRLIVTASAGPFLRFTEKQMKTVTVEMALKHPNWTMGPKITIDSATMMNKGLEVIEAKWLFNIPSEKIEVLVHPQSIVHSLVEFCDTSVIAQLGLPDMKAPIAFALNYPDRGEVALPSLDLARLGTLTFEEPDHIRFPSLKLAYAALDTGKSAPAVLNAANEVAVETFLDNRMPFQSIPKTVERTLSQSRFAPIQSLADALDADREARAKAGEIIESL